MLCLVRFPRYTCGQPPQTVPVVQQFVGIGAPQTSRAFVFAPQPAPQPVLYPVIEVPKHSATLPVVEVSTPAAQQCIELLHGFGYRPVQGPMVEQAAHVVVQSLLAFSARFNVRIAASAQARASPAHADRHWA